MSHVKGGGRGSTVEISDCAYHTVVTSTMSLHLDRRFRGIEPINHMQIGVSDVDQVAWTSRSRTRHPIALGFLAHRLLEQTFL
jgi:hypothetical protein